MRFFALIVCAGCASVLHHDRSLMEADHEFARQAELHKVDGWVDAFAPDGKQVVRGGRLVAGHEAIRALMTPFFEKLQLKWAPDEAESSGDVGWTLGHYSVVKDFVVIERGKYVTNWRRVDGRWYVTLDIGSPERD